MCLLPATAPKPFLPSIALSSLNCRQSSMSDGAPSGQEIATATRTSSPRLDALKSWLAANNVHLSAKLEIRSAQSDGNERTEARQQKEQKEQHEEESFAIYALRDIQQDEILAVTPRSAILSRRTCSLANAPAFHRLCAQVEAATPQQAGVRILATALTHEILLGEHSRWHAYILSMPQSCAEVGLSTFWDDGAALSWLRGTDVLTYMTQQKCTRVSCCFENRAIMNSE